MKKTQVLLIMLASLAVAVPLCGQTAHGQTLAGKKVPRMIAKLVKKLPEVALVIEAAKAIFEATGVAGESPSTVQVVPGQKSKDVADIVLYEEVHTVEVQRHFYNPFRTHRAVLRMPVKFKYGVDLYQVMSTTPHRIEKNAKTIYLRLKNTKVIGIEADLKKRRIDHSFETGSVFPIVLSLIEYEIELEHKLLTDDFQTEAKAVARTRAGRCTDYIKYRLETTLNQLVAGVLRPGWRLKVE